MFTRSTTRLLIAEACGLFFILLIGGGSVASNAERGGTVGLAGIAMAFGLAVALAIIMGAAWGGGDYNTAVTIARALRGEIRWPLASGMMLAQLAGAIGAAIALRGFFPHHFHVVTTTTDMPGWQAMLLEMALTCALIRIARSASPQNAPWVAGAVVALNAMIGGPLCAASMNPARSLGPALVYMDARALGQLWIYGLGPTVGAVLAIVPFATMEAKAKAKETAKENAADAALTA